MHQSDAKPIPWVIEFHTATSAKPIRAAIHDWMIIGQGVPGADPQPDIDLRAWNADESVACQHLLLYREDDTLMVMDLNSQYGSALNGHPLETSVGYPLTHGDQLFIGSMRLDVRVILAPVSLSTSQEQADTKEWGMSKAGQNQWVLIVEHDTNLAQILCEMMEAAEYTVKIARDVVSAMRIFSQKQPNAVIMDLNLPDMDGIEFCGYVRRDVLHGTIPMVVFNSGETQYTTQDVTHAGADVLMENPLNAANLRDMTIALINQHENSANAIRTRRLPNATPFTVFPSDTRHQGMVIYVVGQENEPIVLQANGHKSVSFGRKPGSETLGSEAHIDLTRYDAVNCGVSRVHMFLHYQDNQFYVEDVDSRNGTFVNGNAIPSFERFPVHNGDEIRLGHLRMYMYLIEDTVAVA